MWKPRKNTFRILVFFRFEKKRLKKCRTREKRRLFLFLLPKNLHRNKTVDKLEWIMVGFVWLRVVDGKRLTVLTRESIFKLLQEFNVFFSLCVCVWNWVKIATERMMVCLQKKGNFHKSDQQQQAAAIWWKRRQNGCDFFTLSFFSLTQANNSIMMMECECGKWEKKCVEKQTILDRFNLSH